MTTEVRRYWFNRVLCWHAAKHRRVECSNNGAVLYCGKCHRKRLGLHEFRDMADGATYDNHPARVGGGPAHAPKSNLIVIDLADHDQIISIAERVDPECHIKWQALRDALRAAAHSGTPVA